MVPPARPRTEVPEAILGETLDGEAVALPLRGAPTLLAFLSSSCTTCRAFWDAFATGLPIVPVGARLAVVTRDVAEESARTLADLAPERVPMVCSTSGWDALDVPGSPYFLLVDAGGAVIGEGSGASWHRWSTCSSRRTRAPAAVAAPASTATRRPCVPPGSSRVTRACTRPRDWLPRRRPERVRPRGPPRDLVPLR